VKEGFKRVCIIGVGLIGGSLALGIKKRGLAEKVVGVFRRRSSLYKAKRGGIVDEGYLDHRKALEDSDLVILATPIYKIIEIGKQIRDDFAPDSILMDVGSTKYEIVKELSKIYPNFVGSHPLAGSEKRGCEHASADLFDSKTVIITPTKSTNKEALSRVKWLWEGLGAKVLMMEPRIHDKILSKVSHLPHLLMFCLLETVGMEEIKFASSGFKDSTRIAASDPDLWIDVFKSNKANLLRDIDKYISNLNKYKQALEKGNFGYLKKKIKLASIKRRQL
jgi:prephenate dehydrogenase